jgi:hypothetical protein
MASLESTQSQPQQQIRMVIQNWKSVILFAARDFLEIMMRIALPFVSEKFQARSVRDFTLRAVRYSRSSPTVSPDLSSSIISSALTPTLSPEATTLITARRSASFWGVDGSDALPI